MDNHDVAITVDGWLELLMTVQDIEDLGLSLQQIFSFAENSRWRSNRI